MATPKSPQKIGFLADTHSSKNDGSDLPDRTLAAFKGVDLIVHLGDIGKKKILDRLGDVAPVWVQNEDRKGYVPWLDMGAAPVRVIEAGSTRLGLTFNLAQPDKKIVVGDEITFPDGELGPLFKRRFGQPEVDVVAFGGTHTQMEQRHGGVLFFNPGSPNMPMPGCSAGVAILDLKAKPKVKLVAFT